MPAIPRRSSRFHSPALAFWACDWRVMALTMDMQRHFTTSGSGWHVLWVASNCAASATLGRSCWAGAQLVQRLSSPSGSIGAFSGHGEQQGESGRSCGLRLGGLPARELRGGAVRGRRSSGAAEPAPGLPAHALQRPPALGRGAENASCSQRRQERRQQRCGRSGRQEHLCGGCGRPGRAHG